jgi:acyl-CoA thioesterase I
MTPFSYACHIAAALFSAILLPVVMLSLPATPALSTDAPNRTYACGEKGDLARLRSPLPRMAQRIATGRSVTIMALGSSSTAGAGASDPTASYPSRLEAELRTRFPDLVVTVINRGVNGDEAAAMLARFDQVAPGDKADVVLWQVGTNAILRDDPLGPVDRLIKEGLDRMKTFGADVVMIDPQFAPKVLAKPDAEDMVHLIAAAAEARGVDLFHRFAVMRAWREQDGVPFEAFLSPDQLHMNDWGYACIAKLLGGAIVEAATRPIADARVMRP